MTPKTVALLLLGLVALVGPILESWWTGRVESLSNFDLGLTLVAISLIFWWYHVDKRERGYQAGPLMNAGVVALSMVALPVYFIRSRGWKRGLLATLVAAAIFGVLLGLGELGERIGEILSPPSTHLKASAAPEATSARLMRR
jgi:hypothetical protein